MFTLKDYLALPELKDAILLTSPVNMAEIKISGISVQESPVEDFVAPDELVLTTAMNCLFDEGLLLSFINDVIASKAAALIMSFRPADLKLPDSVLEAANSVSFPIIRVPWENRFSDLTRAALRGIDEDENAQYTKYEALQKELLQGYLHDEPLDFAARRISDLLHVSVVIYDRFRRVRCSRLIFPDSALENCLKTTSEIKTNHSLFGYLETLRPASSSVEISEDSLESSLSIPLSLWFNKEDVINITSLKIKNNFISELAKNTSADMDNLLHQGEALGFTMDIPYVAITLCMLPKSGSSSYTSSLQSSYVHAIEELILTECKKKDIPNMTSFFSNQFLVYVSLDNMTDINSFISRLEFKITPDFPEYTLIWGIGELPPRRFSFADQYNKASLALEKCILAAPPSRRLTYDESRITGLVFQTADNSHLKKQARDILNPLFGDSRTDDSGELLNTLTVYIQSNYNASLTAREMHLHRQTLLYRLDKIQQLTGCSLSSHEDLFLLEFCLRLLNEY